MLILLPIAPIFTTFETFLRFYCNENHINLTFNHVVFFVKPNVFLLHIDNACPIAAKNLKSELCLHELCTEITFVAFSVTNNDIEMNRIYKLSVLKINY